ncbi:MAG: NADPH:quinone reductase [Alphaproteobacteria bacterium]|nr:NADPH:quinone reductase [Alphaproteobacteria bacterium]
MRAASYTAKGSARDVLTVSDHPVPECGASDVLIRLHYSGINPSDVKMRAGQSLGGMTMPFPQVIPHSDGAGVVEQIGDDVTGFAPGDRVYVFNGGFKRAHGTAAEYIAIDQSQVIPLPDNTSFQHGACLGIPAMTAVHAVTRAPSIDGKTVLISSGGGVVGRYCIEVARALGAARIITTASSELSQSTARNAGADVVLDYNSPDLARAILDHCDGVDHAVEAEFGLNADTLGQVMATNSSIAAYGSALNKTPQIPFYDFMFKNITIHTLLVYLLDAETRAQDVAMIHDLLTRDAISANIADILPLDDAAIAHEKVEAGGKSGSILLDLT